MCIIYHICNMIMLRIKELTYTNWLEKWLTHIYSKRISYKKQRHHFTNKGPSGQSYGFSSSYVWMWELDYKKSWVLKDWCFWTVVLEKTLKSPLDCMVIQPVNPKGNQSWMFFGDWCWSRNSNTLATLCKLINWKRPWYWERLKVGGEGDDRGWDGWMRHEFE